MGMNTKDRQTHLQFAQLIERLRSMNVQPSLLDPIVNLVSLIVFRSEIAESRPALVGFIGCTGVGKSTLFNSLAQQEISATGWKAHNTKGPILLSDDSFFHSVTKFEQEFGHLFLPDLNCTILSSDKEPNTFGAVESLHWAIASLPKFSNIAWMDLPDINTTKSRMERLLALELLPWLDAVVFVVDEETLYHRDYEEPVRLSKSFQQSRFCVLNNRGKDRIVLDHPDFQDCVHFFGVDDLYVLPVLQNGSRFTDEEEFQRLCQSLPKTGHAPIQPLYERLTPFAQDFLRENNWRYKAFSTLQKTLETRLREVTAEHKPIGFQPILNDEVIQALQHLGLKRFSVSNLLNFMRSVGKTGNIKRSFSLAFGNTRGKLLEHVIRIDMVKYKEEVNRRLQDIEEELWTAFRRHPDHNSLLELAPELRRISFSIHEEGEARLQGFIHEFENGCRELLQTDTLSTSVKNDPLIALGLVGVLITDVVSIPGFGSWLLVPSVMKFLPIGKFERVKQKFQQETSDFILQHAREGLFHLQKLQKQFCLAENDPAYCAIKEWSQS